MQGGCRKIRVVPKRHNPTLRYNFRDAFAFRFQCLQRVQVVSRHPRQRQVMPGWQHIRYKNHRAIAAGQSVVPADDHQQRCRRDVGQESSRFVRAGGGVGRIGLRRVAVVGGV